MNASRIRSFIPVAAAAAGILSLVLLLASLQGCSSHGKPDGGASTASASAGSGGNATGRGFKSPQEAVDALTAALRADNDTQLLAIMGPNADDIINSGDDVEDRQRRAKFLRLYDEKHALVREEQDDENSMTLVVGKTDWPFPIPIVHNGKSWAFDTEAGRDEILNRRIGDNELSAIQVCEAIADAQREFALRTWTADGVHQYAGKFASDPGKHNGLYWPTAEGEEPSPLGELVADAASEGYTRRDEGPTPYHGYYYRILESQGPNAPGGAVDYVVDGQMTLGFGLVAYPADYGNSGIMTFIMGPEGIVYQKDLGEDTAKLAGEMKAFDPGKAWTKAEER